MSAMAQKRERRDDYELNKNLRALFATEAALDRAVATLRERGDLLFRGSRVNMQAIVNASWLMLEKLEPQVLAEMLRPHLLRLEAMLRGEPDPGFADRPEVAKPVGHSKNQPRGNQAAPVPDHLPPRIVRKK